ncbi:hypothetical protein PSAB6_60092 [Paraburkholderia sabiae]|nr:hypothetical protein PSAB6_60092 [Paraburkholderia sabiae]
MRARPDADVRRLRAEGRRAIDVDMTKTSFDTARVMRRAADDSWAHHMRCAPGGCR